MITGANGQPAFWGRVFQALAVVVGVVLSQRAAADNFTQRFTASNDLAFKSIRFSPIGGTDYYSACVANIEGFPVSTATANEATLTNDGFFKISPGFSIEFYGQRYDSVYIGANGYVTLGFGDIASVGALDAHFSLPRISAFFADLNPELGGTINWQVIGTKVVITFRNISLASDIGSRVNFQVELFSSGGVIVSWLALPTFPMLAGLSRGNGIPQNFQDSDLSAYTGCVSSCLSATISAADELEKIYANPPLNFPVDEMDLDVNGIPDVLNLRVLERVILDDTAFGHCQALAAWEKNLAILEGKIAVLPNNFFVHWTRDEFLRAITGMATLGDGRFPQSLVRLLGRNTSLGIVRGELDDSAEPYVSWSGDMDLDGVCNRGEFEAAASFEAFLIAAFDPNISDNGGECFDEIFEFPDGEPSDEGESEGGVQEGDLLCRVEMRSQNLVPPVNNPYFGRADFTAFGEQVLVTVTHTVPQPAQVLVFRGEPGQLGAPFVNLGSGPSPVLALLPRESLDVFSTGFYMQVNHTGTQSNVDVRGQIDCLGLSEGEDEGEGAVDGEGAEEGEGGLEGEGEVLPEGEGEGLFEGEGEGINEGEVSEGEGQEEGEFLPFTSCVADINGQSNHPPVTTSYNGLLVLSNLGELGRLIIFHNIPNPTFGSLHLGLPGQTGPQLLSFKQLASPIILDLPIATFSQVAGGAYVRLGYAGFTPGEIRGNLSCSLTSAEGAEDGEAEGTMRIHSADYIGQDHVIELTELLRVIQIFNVGSFGCGGGESGYEPGSADRTCAPADFDYNPQNWAVDLAEVLRLVQLYNAGGYLSGQPTEDGFAPLE